MNDAYTGNNNELAKSIEQYLHMSLSAEFQSTKPDDSTQIICKQLGISESDLIQYGQQK